MQKEMFVEDLWRPNMKTQLLARLRISACTALAIAGLTIFLTLPAQASNLNLIQNPAFNATNGVSSPVQVNPTTGQPGPAFTAGAVISPWTVAGFVFLFGPNSNSPSLTNADFGVGAPNHFNTSPTMSNNGFCLYGPGGCGTGAPRPVQNGLTIGPKGGDFLALDAALTEPGARHLRGEISQTITGLTAGHEYELQFNWAAAQQAHFTGATTEQVEVSLGQETMMTSVLNNPEGGFQDWRPQEFTFTATSSSEVLSFLALGTPEMGTSTGGPPFVLLDGGMTLQPVPEPGTWSLLGIGFAAIAGLAYRRPKSFGVPV